ncbi:MAG: TIGR00730 family Rossman fold protein [Rhodospirillales bacterium]|jgi:uncharacterized protein (TIGR00730 family)|nr:TIGR00730 family Rossman fold protein [Rhodospirillales bacterium]MBT4040290.1 TIGR00730 family Rossman fold protein [Rhodospirillales bacterium]MBT4626834.1 TIGR00730 family Rossman fold protein [Rhodospirillales bacterium]MBT5350506.1 TIGR00730 family Rossman fold protein [Rhodospirillales bacterium]MBT6109964.1 TIGR00730 family Rossman fold protein [Rhodospirillales bacterium]
MDNDKLTQLNSTEISSLCVYCGSRVGDNPAFEAAARQLGEEMAKRNMTLVYGAGSIGIMGILADSVHRHGGNIIGIIPEFLDEIEVGRHDIQEFVVTPNMHERKALMFQKSDAFVILPGGLGSLDETFEIITWRQLGLHDKPIIIANIDGYWDPLVALIESTISRGFAAPECTKLYTVVDDVPGIFDALKGVHLPPDNSRVDRL